jgi:hypothetical protein
MQILLEKIKVHTWDQMDTHLKTLSGVKSRFLVFNFHIRKRDEQEVRRYQMILDMRRLEIRERTMLFQEAKLKELIPVVTKCLFFLRIRFRKTFVLTHPTLSSMVKQEPKN